MKVYRFTVSFLWMCGIVLLFELLFFLHIWIDGYKFSNIDGAGLLTIWASVLMLIFLVFSVLGLINIDNRIRNLHDAEKRVESIEAEMRALVDQIKISADREKQSIVKKAEEEIVKIMDKSAIRQNNFDILTQIQNNPDPEFRIKRYTSFLKDSKNLEGVNLAFVYTQRGLAFQDLRRFDEAEKDFKEAMTLFPEDFDPYLAMGTLLAKERKEYSAAIEYYLKAVDKKPTLAVGYEMIGNAYSNLGEFDKAEEYYSKANDCGLELGEWYYNKALKLRNSGEDPTGEIAKSFYERCIKLTPFFHRAYINLAMYYREKNENDKAFDILGQPIEASVPDEFVQALIQRGICKRLTNDFPIAYLELSWALHFRPKNVLAITNLALVCFGMGKLLEARYYAKLGLRIASETNFHDCDSDMISVINKVAEIEAQMGSQH